MVTTFRIIKTTSAILFLEAFLGCSATQTPLTGCGDAVRTSVILEPPLEQKGEHTIVVTHYDTTVTCAFETGDYVTPFDNPCGVEPVGLMISSDADDDSPSHGPEDTLPIVEGVYLDNIVDEVTVEVDGISYGPLTPEYIETTEHRCSHYEATVQLDR